MGRILAFVNQKGGVGKTTSAVNLAAALQKAGKKVLLCDFDPQANATSGLGVEKSTAAHSTYELVIDGFPAADAVIHTPYCDVLASNVALSGAGVELVGMDAREYALKHALEPLREKYDYIFIDCPPIDIVADTQIIEKLSDRTIFVVRAGLLEREMLPELQRMYDEKRFKNMALLLNGTEGGGKRYGYRYGYKYGYKYGYGSKNYYSN